MTAPAAIPQLGITARELAEACAKAAPYMPTIPVPSRLASFKKWLRS
jgi:hypothetical protein